MPILRIKPDASMRPRTYIRAENDLRSRADLYDLPASMGPRKPRAINRVRACEQRLATKRDHPADHRVAQRPGDR